MIHRKTKDGKYTIRPANVKDVGQMETIQSICFPTLSKEELLTKEQFANHIKVFPEGQLVICDGEKVIASSSTQRVHFPKIDHTLMEMTDHLWITHSHVPSGDWLYQFDIGVLPEYRGQKLSTELYKAHQDTVMQLGMKGQITVGMTIGYAKYKDELTIVEYCEKLRLNEITDPTVTPQRKAGFQWVQPIYHYLEDPAAGNCSIFMVWPLDGLSLSDYLENVPGSI